MNRYEIMRRTALAYIVIMVLGPLCGLAVIGAGMMGWLG